MGDQCYHILRHVAQPFCDSMCTSVRDQVKCNPAEHSLPRGDPVEERPAECSTSMPSDVIAAASSHTPSPRATTRGATSSDTATSSSTSPRPLCRVSSPTTATSPAPTAEPVPKTDVIAAASSHTPSPRATTRSATSSDTATSSITSPSPSPSDMNMVIEMAKTAMQDIKSYQKMNDLRLEETRAMQKDAMQAKRRYEEMIDIISEHFKTSQEVAGITDDAPFFCYWLTRAGLCQPAPSLRNHPVARLWPIQRFFRVVIDEAHRTNGIRDEWVLIADCCALAG